MNIDTTLEEILGAKYSSWKEALDVAMRDNRGAVDSIIALENVSSASFAWTDVREVLGSAEGDNDGPSWIAALLLKDGRYAFIRAWCDYTGWG